MKRKTKTIPAVACFVSEKNMKFKAKIAPRLTIFVVLETAGWTLWEITDHLEEICSPGRKDRGAFGYSFVGACKNITVSLFAMDTPNSVGL